MLRTIWEGCASSGEICESSLKNGAYRAVMQHTQTTIITPNTTPQISDNSFPTIAVAGAVPPKLTRYFHSIPISGQPEYSRLPRPRERCPISGASRTWLIEHDAMGHFLFRVRLPGKMRGTVFVNVTKLLAYLRQMETKANPEAANEEAGK